MSVAESLDRLRAAADDGRLDDVAHRYGVALITVFGSAVRTPQRARDLDVAVSLPAGTDGLLALVGELADLTASDDVDVLVLDGASPTARFSGLVGAQPLYEASPGLSPAPRWLRPSSSTRRRGCASSTCSGWRVRDAPPRRRPASAA